MKRALFAVIAVLVLAALACGSSQGGEKVSTSEAAPPTAIPTPAVYGVGDVIQVQDHTITLNSCEVAGDRLKFNFTLENNGTEDVNTSGWDFTVKNSEGSKLEIDIFDCDPDFSGKIVTGDKLKGNLCWTILGDAPYRVQYEASWFGTGAVLWDVSP